MMYVSVDVCVVKFICRLFFYFYVKGGFDLERSGFYVIKM